MSTSPSVPASISLHTLANLAAHAYDETTDHAGREVLCLFIERVQRACGWPLVEATAEALTDLLCDRD